jgi:GTP pyrophosphokinase
MKRDLAEPTQGGPVPELIAATEQALPQQANALARARAFAEPFIASETLDTGENTLAHADAVAAILKAMGGSEAMQAASYLVYACSHLNKPQEVIAKAITDRKSTRLNSSHQI